MQRASTAGLIRSVARLIAEVSEFMTLVPGDVLSVGVAAGAPRARAGQRVSIAIDGLGRLDNPCSLKERPRPPDEARARRLRRAASTIRRPRTLAALRLCPTAACSPKTQVVWLPPFEVGTIIALGLNYADHAKELAIQMRAGRAAGLSQGPNTLIGHRGLTRRPGDATFMHYECELAVVIGKTARKVARADAMRTSPATRSPTTTRSATTSRTGTARTCA